jgi:hypothetical protein
MATPSHGGLYLSCCEDDDSISVRSLPTERALAYTTLNKTRSRWRAKVVAA